MKLDNAAKFTLVFGTFQMASEGMDIPDLNCVVLASPESDVKQSVGQILRKTHDDVTPLVVDVVDFDFTKFNYAARTRSKFYKQCGFHVTSIEEFV